MNGDGIEDLIIGASDADPNSQNQAGESYVIFGMATNQPPVAVDDSATAAQNTAKTILAYNLLANDTDKV